MGRAGAPLAVMVLREIHPDLRAVQVPCHVHRCVPPTPGLAEGSGSPGREWGLWREGGVPREMVGGSPGRRLGPRGEGRGPGERDSAMAG